MKEITENTRPVEIENISEVMPYVMYRCVPKDRPAVKMTYREMNEDQPTWNIESMIRGTAHLREIAQRRQVLYDVYKPEECSDDPEKKEVKLIYLPADTQPSEKPFIICTAGGAYTCVCSLVESIPSATAFNALGYNVFVLNYRVSDGVNACLPKPLEDLAAAVRRIIEDKDVFGLSNTEYIVNGYSAGGSVASIFCTESKGYGYYNVPKPKALFAVYPAISTSAELMKNEGMRQWFRTIMFGRDYDPGYADSFDVPVNMNANYPPAYIVHAKDDPVVSCEQSVCLKKMLDDEGIPACLELAEYGSHGWGDGSGSGAEGWPERAAAFAESLNKREGEENKMNLQEKMLEKLQMYIDRGNICGAYLKVRRHGKLIVDAGIGTVNEGSSKKVDENTMYRLASMTKPIASAAAMTFVEEGKLFLDAKVSDYIPAFTEKYPELKIIHLLNHSCGIGMVGMPGMAASMMMCNPSDRLADRVERYASLTPDFEPGKGTGYSPSVGFEILGRVLEIIDGKELDEILKERIFEPLGMHDTCFVMNEEQKSRAADLFKDHTIEHTPQSEQMTSLMLSAVDASVNGYYAASAGLWGSARDYDRIAEMYRNEGTLDGAEILKPETVRMMRTPTNDLEPKADVHWGIGMEVFGDYEKSGVFVHEGSYGWSGAYGTHFFVDPEADISFVMCLNADGLGGSESFISRDMEKILLENN